MLTRDLLDAAKRGDYDLVVGEAGVDDVPVIFECAVTDFRSVRRNEGHRRILTWCVENGLDPLVRLGWYDVPALILAAHYGNCEVIAAFGELPPDRRVVAALSVGELPSTFVDHNGFTLLMYCAMSRFANPDMCQKLLASGADPRHVIENRLPVDAAFLCASCGGPVEVMRLLVGAGAVHAANYHQTIEHALEPHQRSGGPAAELAEVVCDAGFDINILRPDLGRTLLHGSAARGTLAAVCWLLDHGADPNVRDSERRTPLHVAAMRNTSPAVVARLLDAGCDPRSKDREGMTAFDHATAKKRAKVAQYLSGR